MELDVGKAIEVAIDVAPGCSSMKEVYEKANDVLGIDRPHSGWRSMLYRNQDGRQSVYAAMQRSVKHTDAPHDDFDVEGYFDAAVVANDLWRRHSKIRDNATIRIKTQRPAVGIVFSSDWHVGNAGTQHRQIRRDNELIASHPDLYAAIGGDGVDNFVDAMKLSHAGHEPVFDFGTQQAVIFRHLLQPLIDSDSLLWVSTGNHDGWTKRVSGLDASFGHLQGIPELYVGQGATVAMDVNGQRYDIFRRHRHRWSSVHNPHHSVVMEYQRNSRNFDVGVIEHQHQPSFALFDGKQREDGTTKRVAIRTGTYKTVDQHAIEFGYDYGSNELPVLILWADTFRMTPVMGLQAAIDILDSLS